VAPNRLLPGTPMAAWQALAWIPLAGAVALTIASLMAPWRMAPVLSLAALLLLAAATGLAAARLLTDAPSPSARVMLGGGAWLAAAALVLLVAEQARGLGGGGRAIVLLVALSGAMALAWTGVLDALSIAVEASTRAEAIGAALVEHLALSGAALGLALLLSVPAGAAGFAVPRLGAALEAALGAVQVVPAIALFGLLVPLLSLLLAAFPGLREAGLGAIGATPALIGITLYLALPLARSVRTGLAAADPAAVAAAEAIGMRPGGITRRVRLPLGLPVFAAGLRVAAVQAVGLVTLAGLVGAGGLGAIVFEGMAQLATDLILLGAFPIVALALTIDALLAAAEAAAASAPSQA
jgi:osmoprotectant transport system permease protein